jgi:hypothetical protein
MCGVCGTYIYKYIFGSCGICVEDVLNMGGICFRLGRQPASQPSVFILVAVWLLLVAVGWFWLCLVAFVVYVAEYVVDYDVEKHLLICKQSCLLDVVVEHCSFATFQPLA